MTKPTILLDKSYLQGSTAVHMLQLAQSHQLLMADVLFYELISSSEPGRSRCFAKFPEIENPVVLVNHVGALLEREIQSHRACGKPSTRYEDIRFEFDEALASKDYTLPPSAAETLQEQMVELRQDVERFVERVRLIPTLIPNLLEGTSSERQSMREAAEEFIATDTDAMMKFYGSLEAPTGERPLPPASILTQDWALFRWQQVQLLFALDAFCRYGGRVPDTLSGKAYEKVEHDVLDAQYLLLGVLEGSLATREKKLQRWFSLLSPNGQLYS